MKKKLFKIIAFFICFSMLFEQSGFAQVAGQLDLSGYIGGLRSSFVQDKFRPLHLRYLSYDNVANTFKLLLDKGDSMKGLSPKGTVPLEETTKILLKYVFIGITLPNESFWVNLRPDSPDDIIDPYLAQTDIGKILLEADLQLKKDTAQATSPQTPVGKKYWDRIYKKAEELFGYENVTIPTLTRPWIVPAEIIIRETKDERGRTPSAYIYKATLKVMLEQDYLKDSATYDFKDPRLKALNEYSSQLIRELIIPKLTREINSSKKYAPLRQVYYSLILAQWFKQRFYGKGGLYSWLINKRNLTGLTSQTLYSVTPYYQAYQQSFKDGEYNIQEPRQTPYGQTVRSYFSGGVALGAGNEIISAMQHNGGPVVPGVDRNTDPTRLLNGRGISASQSGGTLDDLLGRTDLEDISESITPTEQAQPFAPSAVEGPAATPVPQAQPSAAVQDNLQNGAAVGLYNRGLRGARAQDNSAIANLSDNDIQALVSALAAAESGDGAAALQDWLKNYGDIAITLAQAESIFANCLGGVTEEQVRAAEEKKRAAAERERQGQAKFTHALDGLIKSQTGQFNSAPEMSERDKKRYQLFLRELSQIQNEQRASVEKKLKGILNAMDNFDRLNEYGALTGKLLEFKQAVENFLESFGLTRWTPGPIAPDGLLTTRDVIATDNPELDGKIVRVELDGWLRNGEMFREATVVRYQYDSSAAEENKDSLQKRITAVLTRIGLLSQVTQHFTFVRTNAGTSSDFTHRLHELNNTAIGLWRNPNTNAVVGIEERMQQIEAAIRQAVNITQESEQDNITELIRQMGISLSNIRAHINLVRNYPNRLRAADMQGQFDRMRQIVARVEIINGLSPGFYGDVVDTAKKSLEEGRSLLLDIERHSAAQQLGLSADALQWVQDEQGKTLQRKDMPSLRYRKVNGVWAVFAGGLSRDVDEHTGLCVTADTFLPIVADGKRIAVSGPGASVRTGKRNRVGEVGEIELKPIIDVKPGDYVLSLNEETQQIEPRRINGLLDMGVKPVYRLTTASGRSIKTTANHPYLVRNQKPVTRNQNLVTGNCNLVTPEQGEGKWIKVSELKEGDEIACPVAPQGLYGGASRENLSSAVGIFAGINSVNDYERTFKVKTDAILSYSEPMSSRRQVNEGPSKRQGVTRRNPQFNLFNDAFLQLKRKFFEFTFAGRSKIKSLNRHFNQASPNSCLIFSKGTRPNFLASSMPFFSLNTRLGFMGKWDSIASMSQPTGLWNTYSLDEAFSSNLASKVQSRSHSEYVSNKKYFGDPFLSIITPALNSLANASLSSLGKLANFSNVSNLATSFAGSLTNDFALISLYPPGKISIAY